MGVQTQAERPRRCLCSGTVRIDSCRAYALRAAIALAAALASAAVSPAASAADVVFGSSLEGTPNVTKRAPVDSVYWAQALAGGASGAVPTAGTVRSVTIKGYSMTSGLRTIFIQVLRPQPDGSLLVAETSQPFELPETPGNHTFEPTNMTAQAGDFIGVATTGGDFLIGTDAPGAITNDFSGHGKDMNGDFVRTKEEETAVELLLQVDLVPASSGAGEKGPVKKETPPATPCKCQGVSVSLDPALGLKRRLGSRRHAFGVGFTWHMTCTPGTGGCAGTLQFTPPVIRAGTLPAARGLKLNLTTLNLECKSACGTSTSGRFEIKMRSRAQLRRLFGRTLAFTIYTSCGGAASRIQVNVLIDRSGHVRAAPRARHH
jgi:hypothetical protein